MAPRSKRVKVAFYDAIIGTDKKRSPERALSLVRSLAKDMDRAYSDSDELLRTLLVHPIAEQADHNWSGAVFLVDREAEIKAADHSGDVRNVQDELEREGFKCSDPTIVTFFADGHVGVVESSADSPTPRRSANAIVQRDDPDLVVQLRPIMSEEGLDALIDRPSSISLAVRAENIDRLPDNDLTEGLRRLGKNRASKDTVITVSLREKKNKVGMGQRSRRIANSLYDDGAQRYLEKLSIKDGRSVISLLEAALTMKIDVEVPEGYKNPPPEVIYAVTAQAYHQVLSDTS